jgi:hypothetical protein
MKAIIFKVLSVVIACSGMVVSIIEANPIICLGFLIGGLISYELAFIISKIQK